jgi:hypothetical protein
MLRGYQEEHMTDAQFQQLFAAQLAQIALLQAIEANVSFMAHKHVPTERIHPNWKKAHELLESAMKELAPAAK